MRRERLAVGRIKRAHGTDGWVRVACYSSQTSHLEALTAVTLGDEDGPREVEGVRRVSGAILLKLRGVDAREQADALGGAVVWIAREAAAPAAEGEYYVGDLCGCEVRQRSAVVGTVSSFVEGGATELLEVKAVDGGTFLVPFLDAFVGEVSVEKGFVELREAFEIEGVRSRAGRGDTAG